MSDQEYAFLGWPHQLFPFGHCWAHITDCDQLCKTNSCHGADFHACDQEAVDELGLCERHRREITGVTAQAS